MPRENSFSDSEGRSLTPDLEEENDFDVGPSSPITASPVANTTQPANPAFSFPPPNTQPATTPLGITIQPPISETVSAPSAIPTRKGTQATFLTANGTLSRPAPIDKFRMSVRKVIHMTRGSSALSLGGVGAEPGIDPRRSSAYMNYGHIHEKCTIELVDYSAVRSSFGRMENKGFIELMEDPTAHKREPWVKVRWINIGGLSWDVISTVALQYNIHPLALEDILHQRPNARSKADYYLPHLFLRVLRHTLAPEDDEDNATSPVALRAPPITNLVRSTSPDVMREEDEEEENGEEKKSPGGWADGDETLAGSKFSTRNTRKRVGIFRKAAAYADQDVEMGKLEERGRVGTTSSLRIRRRRAADSAVIEKLKGSDRVNVKVQPFCILLFRDGTVISINQSTDLDFTAPILARLRQRDTGLRATADASLLVQSLLDLVVDQAMEVVDEYQHKILKLEHDILIRPNIKTVRYLHTMSGDLTLHKRTLDPIKTLVYGLRRYDVDRCAALVNSSGMDATKVEGFMSHKSKIYLADVHDHMDYIITSLDMFSSISENLINYTFNMASYEMNQVMRRLTLATIIFLPLTLLTGYFGMNFMPFSAVNNHSDLLFWEIALPVMAVVIPMFMWADILALFHYVKKRMIDSRLRKEVKKDLVKKTQ